MTRDRWVDTPVWFNRISAPETHSALTTRAYTRTSAGVVVDAWAEVSVGPGAGPHVVRDAATLRKWAWAIHHLCDALEAVTAPPAAAPEWEQLTIDDAHAAQHS